MWLGSWTICLHLIKSTWAKIRSFITSSWKKRLKRRKTIMMKGPRRSKMTMSGPVMTKLTMTLLSLTKTIKNQSMIISNSKPATNTKSSNRRTKSRNKIYLFNKRGHLKIVKIIWISLLLPSRSSWCMSTRQWLKMRCHRIHSLTLMKEINQWPSNQDTLYTERS